jgi:DNA (cytosine-5)-methyltransferase 1
MNYLSVCSGIEAATAAWHPLGWAPVAFSEIERFPSAVLAHRYPNVPNLGDMTRYREWDIADLDLLVGGTPCQSFSVAGLRAGLDDPRGNLALVFLGMVERFRPRWVVWENVPGVLSSSGGRDFGAFLGGLGQLGYGWAYRVLDAQYVRVDSHPSAVPQRRRRVFVVGCAGGERNCAASVLFEPESMSGHPAPRRTAGEGVAGATRGGATPCDWPADVAPTLNAHFGEKQGLEDQHAFNGAGLFTPVLFDPTQITSKANRSNPQPGDPAHTLARGMAAPVLAQSHAVRRLTPRECERLQGFPDDFTLIPYRGKAAEDCPDGPRYKALGNSMAVNVMSWIGQRIAMVEDVS